MKRILPLLLILLLLVGCAPAAPPAQVIATTLPVYEFTQALCENTGIQVKRLITEEVSCLHNYSLQVSQMQALESAELIVMTGTGLESFVTEVAPRDIPVVGQSDTEASHHHDHDHHHQEEDPHIWLMPTEAIAMSHRICEGLCNRYPKLASTFRSNLQTLEGKLTDLEQYGKEQLAELSCRELVTFHDGFSYLAEAFGLTVLCAIEEESGSEASASQLKELAMLIRENDLPAIFTEKNGSSSAAQILSRETGVAVYSLDMALSGDSYFTAMYHNIDTLKEALG